MLRRWRGGRRRRDWVRSRSVGKKLWLFYSSSLSLSHSHPLSSIKFSLLLLKEALNSQQSPASVRRGKPLLLVSLLPAAAFTNVDQFASSLSVRCVCAGCLGDGVTHSISSGRRNGKKDGKMWAREKLEKLSKIYVLSFLVFQYFFIPITVICTASGSAHRQC